MSNGSPSVITPRSKVEYTPARFTYALPFFARTAESCASVRLSAVTPASVLYASVKALFAVPSFAPIAKPQSAAPA